MRLPIHRQALSTYQKRHKPKWYYEVDAIKTHTGKNDQDFDKKVHQDISSYLCLKRGFTRFGKKMGLKKPIETNKDIHTVHSAVRIL